MAGAVEVCAGGKLFSVVVDTDRTASALLRNGQLQRQYSFDDPADWLASAAQWSTSGTPIFAQPSSVDAATAITRRVLSSYAAHGVEHTIEDQLHAVANKLHAAEHRVDEAAHRAAPKTMHVVDEVKHKVHDAEHAVADKIHAVGDKIHAAEHKLEDAIHHRVDEAKHRIELARADAKRKAELFKRRFERHGRHR